MQPTIDNVNSLLQNANRISDDLADVSSQLRKASPDIPDIMLRSQNVLTVADDVLRAAKQSLFAPTSNNGNSNPFLRETPRDIPLMMPLKP